MTGVHEAFDRIVADVPVYGDVERAIEQVDRERRRRNGVLAGLVAAAAVVAVIVGVLAFTTGMDRSTQPVGPSPTPSETGTDTTPGTTAPANLPANGRLLRAEDLFARSLEPCSIVTADYELADSEAPCSIRAQDVDASASLGLFEEDPTDTGSDPDGPPVGSKLRVATPGEVLGRFRSPYENGDAELGPRTREVSLAHDQEITVVGFDGEERRSIDLSAMLVPPEGDSPGEEIVGLERAPDQMRLAVVTQQMGDDGLVTRLWVMDNDGGNIQLVHTATNTLDVPASKTPLSYLWSPTWSPEGGRIGFIEEFAYLGGTEESQTIRAATIDVSGSGASTPRTLYDYPPSTHFDDAEILWAPDGARVALRVPDQVLELSAQDGHVVDSHAMIAGTLAWLPAEG